MTMTRIISQWHLCIRSYDFHKNPIIFSTYSDMFQSILYCGVVVPNMSLFDFATIDYTDSSSPLSSFPSTLGGFVSFVVTCCYTQLAEMFHH